MQTKQAAPNENAPTVTRVPDCLDPCGCRRYLLQGGDVAPDWAASLRPPEAAYCEVTEWKRSGQLGSYGGTVWPSAWPALFQAHRGSAQSGPFTLLTTEARRLFDEADARFEAAQ